MNWYYLNDAREVVGPIVESTLAQLRSIDCLDDNAQVCREGSEDWISLAEALGTAANSNLNPTGGCDAVTFGCPHCNQQIAADSATLGIPNQCPACGMAIQVSVSKVTHQKILPARKGKNMSLILVIICGLALGIGGVFFVTSKHDREEVASQSKLTKNETAPSEPPSEMDRSTEIRTKNGGNETDDRAASESMKKPETPEAQYLNGKKFYEGDGVTRDYAKAARWYKKAAEQHEPRALHELAMMHRSGEGVEKNENEALYLISEAANWGNHESQYVLGNIHKSQQRMADVAYLWFSLSAASSDQKIATLAKSELATLSKRMTTDQIAKAQRLSQGWTPGKKDMPGVFIREKNVLDQPTKNSDNRTMDIVSFVKQKYPDDHLLAKTLGDGILMVHSTYETLTVQESLNTLEKIFGSPISNLDDAKLASRMVEKLIYSASDAEMKPKQILEAALQSQERIHLMNTDINSHSPRTEAANISCDLVEKVCFKIKQQENLKVQAASLGIDLSPPQTFIQMLMYDENERIHFTDRYFAVICIKGGAADSPSTRDRAQKLLTNFDQATNSIARRHFEIAARELIMEAQSGEPATPEARRSGKHMIKFNKIPKTAEASATSTTQSAKESIQDLNLISHYKSIGFSEAEAEMFVSNHSDKKIEASEAMMLLASIYETLDTFDGGKCMSWLYKAAEAGSPAAMFRLHQILHPNFALAFLGYPEGDAKQSIEWATKAAKNGYADGMNAMGYYYWYGEYENDGGELIMQPNKSQALIWWKRAADAGSADAEAQIEKFGNGIKITEKESALESQPTTNSSSKVALPQAALSALQSIKTGTLDEARECVRLLDEQLSQDAGNTRIQKVKSTIMDIFREEALLMAARGDYQKAGQLLTKEQQNLEIASRPSALTGRVNEESVAWTSGKINAAETAMQIEKEKVEKSRSRLQDFLSEAMSKLPKEERDALSPVWRQIAKRHDLNLIVPR